MVFKNNAMNRKQSKVEKLQVDPEWFNKFMAMAKRRKTGESEGEEKLIEKTNDTKYGDKTIEQNVSMHNVKSMLKTQEGLLFDYLTQIKSFSPELKLKLYIIIIRLINNTKFYDDQDPSKTEISDLEKQVINHISNKDRDLFFEVVKFWIHYKYNECGYIEGPQFTHLFNHILSTILSSRILYKHSAKWVSFILSLPCHPESLFKHIYQVAITDVQKDVPAITVLHKFLFSPCFKISIKKQTIKLLLKTTFSTTIKHSREKAMSVLINAHADGLFQIGRYDMLREYLHTQIHHTFEKFKTEKNLIWKNDVYRQLLFLIFSIALNNKIFEELDVEEQERIDQSKFFYFDLVFKHYDTMEQDTKNLLNKHYFYRLIGSEKFKDAPNKPYFGPLTKDEYKSGLKHPIKIEDNPLVDLLDASLRNLSADEHNCLMEFIGILKTKDKLTLKISHLILEKCILNTAYNDIIKETFSIIFKIQSVKRQLSDYEVLDSQAQQNKLIGILLEQTRHSEETVVNPNAKNKGRKGSHKQTTHSLIIKNMLKLQPGKIQFKLCSH